MHLWKPCSLSSLGLLSFLYPLSLFCVPNYTSHWNNSQQNLSLFLLGQNLRAECQPQALDPSATFDIIAYSVNSAHLWLSPSLMLLLLTEGGPSPPSPPSNFVLILQIVILCLFCSHTFLLQSCLCIQTQASLLWQWLTNLFWAFFSFIQNCVYFFQSFIHNEQTEKMLNFLALHKTKTLAEDWDCLLLFMETSHFLDKLDHMLVF